MDERKTFSVGSFCEPSIALFAFTVTFCIERTFCHMYVAFLLVALFLFQGNLQTWLFFMLKLMPFLTALCGFLSFDVGPWEAAFALQMGLRQHLDAPYCTV